MQITISNENLGIIILGIDSRQRRIEDRIGSCSSSADPQDAETYRLLRQMATENSTLLEKLRAISKTGASFLITRIGDAE